MQRIGQRKFKQNSTDRRHEFRDAKCARQTFMVGGASAAGRMQVYFAKGYREGRKGKLFPDPATMFRNIASEDVRSCRRVLKNAYADYRGGRNAEALKRLMGEYREYVSCCYDGQAKDRYNAFVYRHMLGVPVDSRAIAAKLGVAKETILNYVNRCADELLMLCMGIPSVGQLPKDREAIVRMLIGGSRLFSSMAGDYVF